MKWMHESVKPMLHGVTEIYTYNINMHMFYMFLFCICSPTLSIQIVQYEQTEMHLLLSFMCFCCLYIYTCKWLNYVLITWEYINIYVWGPNIFMGQISVNSSLIFQWKWHNSLEVNSVRTDTTTHQLCYHYTYTKHM